MRKIVLSFLSGFTLMLAIIWLIKLDEPSTTSELVILGWFAGIFIGSWITGLIMFLFSQIIGNSIASNLVKSYTPPPPPPQPEIIEVVLIEDDEDMDIDLSDPDWWKDDKKREQHRRRNEEL